MKKLMSVLLAFIMVCSVTAYGVTLELPKEEEKELAELPMLELDEGVSTFTAGKGGTFYVMLDCTKDYKKVTVTDEGCVEAEAIKYDPEKHVALDGIYYCVKNGETVVAEGLGYDEAKEKAEELNDTEKTTKYKVALDDCFVNVIEIKVADNYTAEYKEGKVKIKAEVDEKEVSAVIKVVSDVFVYDVENVKWAAANEEVLDDTFDGLSAYDKATKDTPNVVSKLAFKHIKGKDLVVENGGVKILIKEVNASQPAVNFKGFVKIQQENEEEKIERELSFGFYGNEQKVYSDFVVTADLGMDYFELREFFGVKLEDEDVVAYKVYKNEKLIYEFVVDYMKVDINKEVELEIKCENGGEIGYYEITAEHVQENEDVEEEENPNTGAPVFIS